MKLTTVAALALGGALVFGATYRGGFGQLQDDLGFCLKTGGDICAMNAGDLRVGIHPATRVRALFAGATQLPFVEADIKEELAAPVVLPVFERPAVTRVDDTIKYDEPAHCTVRTHYGEDLGDAPCKVDLVGGKVAAINVGDFTFGVGDHKTLERGAVCLSTNAYTACAVGNFNQ